MTKRIQTEGGRVAYEVYGESGTPIVAIPGIGDTKSSYRILAPILSKMGYMVYVMDLRGHGGSDTNFDSYTSEDIGNDTVALMNTLDLQGVTLLGNSVGAAASVHASLKSDRIERIVMLSGFVRDPHYFGFMRLLILLIFAWPWGLWFWGKYRKTLFKSPPADLKANHTEVLTNLSEPGRLRAVRAMMYASKAAISARLHEVSVPTLIAMGAQDPDFSDPAKEAYCQKKLLGGQNQVVMIESAGHYPQIEQPEQTAQAILTFIQQG